MDRCVNRYPGSVLPLNAWLSVESARRAVSSVVSMLSRSRVDPETGIILLYLQWRQRWPQGVGLLRFH